MVAAAALVLAACSAGPTKSDRLLLAAAHTGETAGARAALERGADVNAVEPKTGYTPLIVAAEKGHLEIVELLLASEADVAARDGRGFTALHYASMKGTYWGGDHWDPVACPAIIARLIEGGADVNAADQRGITPLHLAVFNESDEVVKELLEHGADPNSGQDLESMPLHEAAASMNLEIAGLLLDAGADPQRAECAFLPLFVAVNRGDVDEVRQLLAAGADVNARARVDSDHIFPGGAPDETPLYLAAQAGFTPIVNVLLAYGAEVNPLGLNGATPLYIAALNGHLDTLIALISAGADLNICDRRNVSPLAAAIPNGHVDIVRALIEAGAAIDTVDKPYGWTPLHTAASCGQLEIVRLLLAAGADPAAVAINGDIPRDCALNGDHLREEHRTASGSEIADLLEQHGG